MSWRCVWLEETDQAQVWLRRFRGMGEGSDCSATGQGYHQVMKLVYESVPIRIGPDLQSWEAIYEPLPISSLAWPTHCPCGYRFQLSDMWQHFTRRLYRRADTGELLTTDEAQPGAMWNAPWLRSYANRGADGLSILVRLPGGGEWMVDGPSSNGEGWNRTGTPPDLTVTPSILSHPTGSIRGYHGYLTNGELTDDLEGRTYP